MDSLPDLSYHSWPFLSTSAISPPCCSLDTPGLVIPPRSCLFLECPFSKIMQCINRFLLVFKVTHLIQHFQTLLFEIPPSHMFPISFSFFFISHYSTSYPQINYFLILLFTFFFFYSVS